MWNRIGSVPPLPSKRGLSWLVLGVIASVAIASIVGAAYAADVSDPARVIDGHTLEVSSTRHVYGPCD
jgi:hypothetical protein